MLSASGTKTAPNGPRQGKICRASSSWALCAVSSVHVMKIAACRARKSFSFVNLSGRIENMDAVTQKSGVQV
jgi:hypothetical protein